MRYILPLLLLISVSCGSKKNSRDVAIGLPGRINIVITPELWKDGVGKSLDSLLTQEMTVLPRPETIFKTRQVNPESVNSSMKRTRNLIFVFTMDDNSISSQKIKKVLSEETMTALQQDTTQFMRGVSDVFAFGQEVLFLFGPDKNMLNKKIKKNSQRIIDYFNVKERERITKGLLTATTTKVITERLVKEKHFSIKVPFGYKVADSQNDFVWLRQINPADDKDIWIARKPYTSQDDFKREKLIQFRNEACRKYLFEDPEQDDTFLITETEVSEKPVETREFNFNGKYAVEMKGLWRSNLKTMGGPFQAFAFVDEKTQQFYYIEGFTFCPSKDQREIMRELECILYTFKAL